MTDTNIMEIGGVRVLVDSSKTAMNQTAIAFDDFLSTWGDARFQIVGSVLLDGADVHVNHIGSKYQATLLIHDQPLIFSDMEETFELGLLAAWALARIWIEYVESNYTESVGLTVSQINPEQVFIKAPDGSIISRCDNRDSTIIETIWDARKDDYTATIAGVSFSQMLMCQSDPGRILSRVRFDPYTKPEQGWFMRPLKFGK